MHCEDEYMKLLVRPYIIHFIAFLSVSIIHFLNNVLFIICFYIEQHLLNYVSTYSLF